MQYDITVNGVNVASVVDDGPYDAVAKRALRRLASERAMEELERSPDAIVLIYWNEGRFGRELSGQAYRRQNGDMFVYP